MLINNGQDAIILRHSENGFIILLYFAVPWVVIDTDRKTQTKLCILHTISRNMSDSLHLTTNAHDKLYIVPLVYCTWGSVYSQGCRQATNWKAHHKRSSLDSPDKQFINPIDMKMIHELLLTLC